MCSPQRLLGGTNHANVYMCCFLHSSCSTGHKQSSVQSPASNRRRLVAKGRGEADHSACHRFHCSTEPQNPERTVSSYPKESKKKQTLNRLAMCLLFVVVVVTNNYIRINLEQRDAVLVRI